MSVHASVLSTGHPNAHLVDGVATESGLPIGEPLEAGQISAVLPHEGAELPRGRGVSNSPLYVAARRHLEPGCNRTDERGRRLRSFLSVQLRAPVCDAVKMSQRDDGVTGTLNPNIRGTSPC